MSLYCSAALLRSTSAPPRAPAPRSLTPCGRKAGVQGARSRSAREEAAHLPPFGVAKIIDDIIESKMNFFSEQITNVPCYLSIGLPVKISSISIDD